MRQLPILTGPDPRFCTSMYWSDMLSAGVPAYITLLITTELLITTTGRPFGVGLGKGVTVAVTTMTRIGVAVRVTVSVPAAVGVGDSTTIGPVGIGVNVAGRPGIAVRFAAGVSNALNGVGVSSGDLNGVIGVMTGLAPTVTVANGRTVGVVVRCSTGTAGCICESVTVPMVVNDGVGVSGDVSGGVRVSDITEATSATSIV